ncbi:PTS transporter subunit EIIC [Clostridiaceae bacterium UIB06]|uniref:PTS transporter subunit EIIC n=1 Tax=Clostridium thailandense TaxID=2794346 RepID=A0A949TS12_9CLOT|nr:glucose PTS transporter subunit IIA [Clostridium thailandense]MBV7272276.1 PTS transporter subunit EIIC [Clostridium thailandense]MCH5137822.1 PTS transporter subunit EIIC [Clostridiaceae bacterium UIB06]
MKRLFAALQKIGKSLMLPVSVLPAAGILLRFGQPDLFNVPFIAKAGDVIFNNLPMIFAVGVAIGFSGGEGVAALAAVVGQLIFEGIMGMTQTNMGVIGGVLVGIISGVLYNRYHKIRLPQVLGFFGGKRFVPIITSIVVIIFSMVVAVIWPSIQKDIDMFARWACSSYLGPAFYAAGKRLLIPLGLHHIYYPIFLYQFGSYVGADGVKYFGDTARYFHGDPTAGTFMASEFPILMFGLPGAAMAMIAAAKPENRRKISGIMISAAFVAFLTGITEPIEFSFIFVAPILFAFHVIAAFSAGIVTDLLGIKLGYTFSASAIDYIIGYKFAKHPLLLIPVGLTYFLLYFVVFYTVIRAMNIKTPGREEEETLLLKFQGTDLEKAALILDAVGGKDNIEVLDSCITRLRLTLKDPNMVNKTMLKESGASGIFDVGENVQIIYGTEAESIKDDIKSIIENREQYRKSITNMQDSIELLKDNYVYGNKTSSELVLFNPIEGEIIKLEEVPDIVFSEKLLGDGFAVIPKDNKVYSPVDGIIRVLFPTKHAIAIKTEEDIEILVHIGVDTVSLNGEGFTTHVKQGDKIRKGDLMISFDKQLIEKNVKSLISPVIITSMDMISKIDTDFGYAAKGSKVSNAFIR